MQLDEYFNALNFWKDNIECVTTAMEPLIKLTFVRCASSSDAESQFSIAGFINQGREQLTDTNLEMLTYVCNCVKTYGFAKVYCIIEEYLQKCQDLSVFDDSGRIIC